LKDGSVGSSSSAFMRFTSESMIEKIKTFENKIQRLISAFWKKDKYKHILNKFDIHE
jgi:hypothetical protein